ncbi:MAG: hypothetical protein J6Q13_01475 [Clostridia bacterium]|nr:hypothetical protein [Clostridia bacterium]
MNGYTNNPLEDFNAQFKNICDNYENNTTSAFDTLPLLKDLKDDVFYSAFNKKNSEVNTNLVSLFDQICALIEKINEEMKTIHIIRTDKTKIIACANAKLAQKCIARLGKDAKVATYKIQICETEEDLNNILLEDKLKEDDLSLL